MTEHVVTGKLLKMLVWFLYDAVVSVMNTLKPFQYHNIL